MAKPVCVKCHRFYKPAKNGFAFIEGMPKPGVTNPRRGTEAPSDWEPYKLWVGDKWQCQGCNHEIIISNLQPVSERYYHDFRDSVEAFEARYQVNDC